MGSVKRHIESWTTSVALRLLNLIQLLHNHSTGSTAAVTNGSNAILARLQLVQQSDQDARSRAAEGMAQRDGTSQRVDAGVLKTQDLRKVRM